jgi:hypothetical protein
VTSLRGQEPTDRSQIVFEEWLFTELSIVGGAALISETVA